MSDLVSRLSETLNELERVARAATDGPWEFDGTGVDVVPTTRSGSYIARFAEAFDGGDRESITQENGEHIARWDPKAVLGLVKAVREIIEIHRACEVCRTWRPGDRSCETARTLAAGFGITEEG